MTSLWEIRRDRGEPWGEVAGDLWRRGAGGTRLGARWRNPSPSASKTETYLHAEGEIG